MECVLCNGMANAAIMGMKECVEIIRTVPLTVEIRRQLERRIKLGMEALVSRKDVCTRNHEIEEKKWQTIVKKFNEN